MNIRAARRLLLCLFLLCAATPLLAQTTFTSVQSGPWNDPNTWDVGGGQFPSDGSLHHVVIASGHTVTVTSSALAADLTFTGGGTSRSVTVSSGQFLTINGAVTFNDPSGIGVTNTLDVGSGDATVGSVVLFGGSVANSISQLSIGIGTLTVNGNVTVSGLASNAKITFSGAGTLDLSGSLGNGATLTNFTGAPGSTIRYSGTGAQTVGAYAYQRLTLNKTSGTASAGGTLSVAGTFTQSGGVFDLLAASANFFSADVNGTINGTIGATFSGSLASLSGTGVINAPVTIAAAKNIANGSTLTLNTITLQSGVTFTNAGTTTVGTITGADATSTWVNNGTLKISGNLLTLAGTLDATNITNVVEYTGAAQTIKPTTYATLALKGTGVVAVSGVTTVLADLAVGGTTTATLMNGVSVAGNVGIGISAALDLGSFTHSVGGNWTNNGILVAGTSLVIFNGGSAQNIVNGTAAFANVQFSGVGLKSSFGGLDVDQNFTIAAGSNFDGSSYTHKVGGNWLNLGTFAYGTSTIDFDGAIGTQTISTSPFYNITFSNAGPKTASGILAIQGSLTINSGATFNAGGVTHLVDGNWTNNGTFNPGSGSISFEGSSSQSIGASNFNNVSFSNPGTKTFTGALSIAGTMSIASGATVNAGTGVSTLSGNLTNDGTLTNSGNTWTLNGATLQTISGTVPISFASLTVTNSFGLSLSQHIQVNNVLNIGPNVISTNAFAVVMSGGSSLTRTSGWIWGELKRKNATGTATFEVGTPSGYSPVTMFITGTADTAVQSVSGSGCCTFNGANHLGQSWLIFAASPITANLTFTWPAGVPGTEANYILGRYQAAAWSYPSSTVTAATHTGTTNGQAINATPASWTAGEPSSLGGAPPVVASFNPTAGSQGVTVILTGSSFTGATNVAFNGTPATFVVDSDTQITTAVPAGATSGTISVTNIDGTGNSAGSFTVNAPGLIQSAASGTWLTPATWVGNIPPGTLDTVQINNTHTVTLTANAACGALTVSSGGTANVGTSTLTVNGAATVNGAVTGTGSLTLSGTATLDGSGTFAPQVTIQGIRTVQSSANLAFNGGMTVQGGATLTNNGQVHVDNANGILGSGAFINSTNATLTVGGPLVPTLTATAPGNSVDYNGGAQTVQAVPYHYLFLSGSSTKTMTGVSSIGADLSISGSAAAVAGANMTISGSVNVNSGAASLTLGSFTHDVAGNWTNNGTVSAAGSVVNFNGSSAQSISRGSSSFDGVTFNGAGIKSMSGAGLLTSGTVNLNAGATFDGGAFTHQIGGSWNNGGGTFLTGTSTIELVSATAATVNGTFFNLKINKPSGTATLASSVIVTDTITLANGVLDVGNVNLTTTTLTGSGALSMGSSGSLSISGDSNTFTGIFIPGTSAVIINGNGSQLLRGGTYYDLYIQKPAGTATLSAATTATHKLWVSGGTLADGGNQISSFGSSTLQVDAFATLILGSGAASTSFPGGFTTNTLAAASDVTYAAANSAQQIASFPNYGWLTVDSGGGAGIVKTVDGGGVINAVRLDPTNGVTLDLAGKTANVSGSLGGDGAITFGASTGAINLGGDFTNTGTFTRGLSTFTYNGTGTQQVRGVSYNNLTINKVSGAAQLAGPTSVFGNLSVTNGSLQGLANALTVEGSASNNGFLDAGSGNWRFRGNVVNNGTFTGSTGTVILDGAAPQTWSGSSIANLNNFQMANISGATLNKSLNVNTLDLAGGVIGVAAAEQLSVSTATITRTAGYVNGALTMNLPNATTRKFEVGTASGYAPVDILPNGAGLMTVTPKQGPHPNVNTASVLQRYWTIATTIPTAGVIQFNWNAGEAVGTESSYTSGLYNGGTWTQPGGTANAAFHFIQLFNPPLTGDWTVGEPSAFAGIADLSVGVTSVPPSVLFNQAYSYSVAVNNAGPDPATGVSVNMTLTGDATITGATAAGWACGNTATTATCTLASLATGAPQTITVNTTANASGTGASLAATVTATSTDTNATNNNASAFTSIGPLQADLALTHVVSGPTSVPPSTAVTFNLSVTNNGTSTATNINLTDVLPSGLSYVSNTASGLICGPVGFNVVCTAATLGVGNTATAAITVNAVTGGTLTATASVSATEADPNAADNTASASVTVINVSSLTVQSNADSGNFTLRQAILDANSGACVVPCSIQFNLPAGQHVISPTSPLPALTARMFLQANSQPGYAGVPIVELDGTNAGGIGLQLTAANSQVRGFVIRNFPNAGLLLSGGGAFIRDNYIGTNLGGTAAAPNTDGVRITSLNNLLEHNLISGNSGSGVQVLGAGATGNSMVNNLIGLNALGNAALPNGNDGIQLRDGANNNSIGDTVQPNTISGNTGAGIFMDTTVVVGIAVGKTSLSGTPTTANVVFSNRIGTNLAGSAAIANGTAAIRIGNDAPANLIGLPGFGNILAGSAYGVRITGSGSDGNIIQGNFIGTDAGGTLNLANGKGIELGLNPLSTVIGGTGANEGNTIAFNGTGVSVLGSQGNSILANSFYGNTTLGIDLDGDAVANANDPGDGDAGGNNQQNHPQLLSANVVGANVNVTLQLESSTVPNTQSLLVEVFKAQGTQGKTFLGRQCYGTNDPGTVGLTFPSALVSVGDPIVATATSYQTLTCTGTVNDGTSEFGNVINVVCTPPAATITHAAQVCANSTGNVASAPAGAASYVWAVTNGTLTGGQGTPSITYNAGSTGSVGLSLTVSNGACSNAGSSSVPIAAAIPAPTITGPSAACPSQSFTLNAGPGYASYSWSNGVTTVGNAQTLTISQTSTTTYTVTVTSGSCTAQASKTVTMTAAPAATITASGPTTFCAGGSVTLDAGAGFASYLWSNGATGQTINVTTSGNFFVTVSNGTCNATSAPVTVTVKPLPSAAISAPSSVCPNTVGAVASVPPTAGASYVWSVTNGTLTSGQGTPSITFDTTAATPVTIGLTVTANGCSSNGSANVTVAAIAPPVISGPASSCSNSTIALSATPGYATYSWSDGVQVVGTTQNITAQPQVNTTYTLTVSNGGGCTASATHAVTVTPAGPVAITAPANVNPNSGNNAASVAARPAGTTYTWSATGGTITGGQGTNAVTFSAGSGSSLTLSITVTLNGCTSTGTKTVAIGQSADLSISKSADVATVNAGARVTFFIGVNNAGPNASGEITVTEAMPAGTTFVSASGDGWTFTPVNATTLNATHAALAAGAGAPPITVVLTAPDSTGPITNVASVNGSVRDPNVGNNTSSATVNVGSVNPNCPNAPPQLMTPAPNAVVADSPITFSWTPVAGASSYELWLSVDGGPAQLFASTGAPSIVISVPSGTVSWFVIARFTSGCAPLTSEARSFTVPRVEPCAGNAAASLLAPANDSTSNSSLIDFQWTSVPNADGYRLWARLAGGAPQVLADTPETSSRQLIPNGRLEWWVETRFRGCPALDSAHFVVTVPRAQNCNADERPSLLAPPADLTTASGVVTFQWSAVPGALRYELWLALGDSAPSLAGTTTATSLAREVPAGPVVWFVRAFVDRCDPRDSARRRFTYAPPASCRQQRPLLSAPAEDEVAFSPVDFRWSVVEGGTSYKLILIRPDGSEQVLPSSNAVNLEPGAYAWVVEVAFDGCSPLRSAPGHFVVRSKPAGCPVPAKPALRAPVSVSSNVPYTLRWSPALGATSYVIQEAANAQFTSATSRSVVGTEASFRHAVTGDQPQAFYYRVRGLSDCTEHEGANSAVVAVFILPPTDALEGAAPADERPATIAYQLQLDPALAGQSFTATPTQPWLAVTPTSGVVPDGGLTLNVTATTATLPLGTSLGSINVTLASGKATAHGTSTSGKKTVTVNLVQPVVPAAKDTPPPDSLIIPAVAHADGINSKFQSDVRVSNTSAEVKKYSVIFTPSGEEGAQSAQQTTITIDPGQTIALDDILRTWFGSGNVASSTGTLEIRPLTTAKATPTVGAVLGSLPTITTFAASRTFNATANGTFGQYIPAIPFASFIGAGGNALTLQQIAQSEIYRTNLGLVEGSGQPASLLIAVFGSSGQKLTEFPIDLKGGQHLQLNSFLLSKNIELQDGRVEVRVTSPGGKVTAYASVLDNKTADPMLVTPVSLSQAGNSKFIVPGVADLSTGAANWRTDMRVFNASSEAVEADVFFYSQTGGEPRTAHLSLGPNEVRRLDNTLSSLFGITNDGGALHIVTAANTNLIATARTYNQTTGGTYGQFISAVTPDQAVALGDRALELLQVEESDRLRSNIGIAEVGGKPVKVQVSVTPPDSKVTASTEIELGPNAFKQLPSLLKAVGYDGTYNARVSVKVVEGEGRITAYASVIDAVTQDPTYVGAQ
jgi:uncharacterized repeat protein (TIGR01451 family)